MLTNMLTSYGDNPETIRYLVVSGNNIIAYAPHLDVNTWRIRLLYCLHDESGLELFSRLLGHLNTLPPIEVPPPSSAALQTCNIRYHHDLEPKTMLQQCLCHVPSNLFSSNLADPESIAALRDLFGVMASKANAFPANSISATPFQKPILDNLLSSNIFSSNLLAANSAGVSNPLLTGRLSLQSYLNDLSDNLANQKIEQGLLKCLSVFFPHQPAYLLLQAPAQMNEGYDENSTFLSFGEEVRSYYKALELLRPSLDYYLPGFDEFANHSSGNCHLALRRGGKLHSVMWAQIIGSTLSIRLLVKLMSGSVLEQMLVQAQSYAFLRKLSAVSAFVNVKQLDRCVERYVDLGFVPTFMFMHNFSF